ncbi:Bet1-like SNARE 1-2 [Capsicum annuum]|nr:Bet1-like SNARE 1-2 [Capsicum annuum]
MGRCRQADDPCNIDFEKSKFDQIYSLYGGRMWDHRAYRAALFDNYDSIEEGGIRASSSYPRDLDERDNGKAVDSLHDRVSFLKKGISCRSSLL